MNKLTLFKCNGSRNMPVPFVEFFVGNCNTIFRLDCRPGGFRLIVTTHVYFIAFPGLMVNVCEFLPDSVKFYGLNCSTRTFTRRPQMRVTSAPREKVKRFIVLDTNFQEIGFWQCLCGAVQLPQIINLWNV